MNGAPTPPMFSTTCLNWNRLELLERTLVSYRETIAFPYELFVIDNGSEDGSAEFIRKFCEETPNSTAILLPNNIGGSAFNIGIEKSVGELIHLSENDVEYIPGWSERVVTLFGKLPTLGQLSLHGPTPCDDEVWEHEAPLPWYENGELLFTVPTEISNVPITSVIRGQAIEILMSNRIQIGNYRKIDSTSDRADIGEPVILPNDQVMSMGVTRLGFKVAWSDHHLIRNIGDSIGEFESRTDYYTANYAAKDLGTTGWNQRIDRWRESPKPERDSPLLSLITAGPLVPEASPPAPGINPSRWWSMIDAFTPEMEVLEFLYGLVRMTKPQRTVVARSWRGYLPMAIGHALISNGFGSAVCLEEDDQAFEQMELRATKLDSPILELKILRAEDYNPTEKIDLLVLDCTIESGRIKSELLHFISHMAPGSFIAITGSRADPFVKPVADSLIRQGLASEVTFATARELTLLHLHGQKVDS